MHNIHNKLIGYQIKNGETRKVFHISVTDASGGLRVLCGLLENYGELENAMLHYVKPGGQQDELSGVVLTIFDPRADVIQLGVLTIGLGFHVITNDSFAAKDFMVRTLFGTREPFNTQNDGLSFYEEWTDEPQIIKPFLSALEELMPSCSGNWL